MKRQRISSGSPIEEKAAFSRAVVEDGWIFVSGCTGVDPGSGKISDNVEEQAHQCFRNVEDALGEAGASLRDVVRVRYFLTEPAHAEPLYPIFREYFSDISPAATAIVCALPDPRARIEIEVTAKVPESPA
jgi:enamine deaminase RidA (YjgF/YER057c/UK114 family)